MSMLRMGGHCARTAAPDAFARRVVARVFGRERPAGATRSGVVLCVVAALLLGGQLGGVRSAWAQSPIVVNGGFEAPVVSGSESFTAPGSFGGWTVDSGRIAVAASSEWAPAGGSQSMAFDGSYSAQSSVSQDVAVQPGRRYRLSFRHADGPVAPEGYIACGSLAGLVMPLEVFWDDVKVATVDWTGGHLTDDWQQSATLVTAVDSSAQLRFTSRRGEVSHCGMTLDDVVLSAPSPAETATTLRSSPNPSVTGQPVTFTATVISGDPETVPEGAVQFRIDGTPAGPPVPVDSAGEASYSLSGLAVGQHSVRAVYQPAAGTSFQASEAPELVQTVAKGDTATSVTVTPDPTVAGQDATFSAVVEASPPSAGTPSGTVAFVDDDGTPIDEPQPLGADGKATLTVASEAGSYLVHANYSGDARFAASTATTPQTVDKADTVTSITSTPNPVAAGGTVEVTVLVAVQEPGDVPLFGSLQFTIDGAAIGPAIPLMGASGVVATFTAPTTAQHAVIGVAYGGDENTNPSSASLVQIVAAPAGSPPPPPAPPSPSPPPQAITVADLHAMVQALRRSLREHGLAGLRRARQRFTAVSAGTLTQRVYSPRAPKPAAARKPALIASARHRFTGAGAATLKLRVTRAGQRRIRHAGKLRLAIVTRFTPAGGPPVSAIDRATVERARAKRTAATSTSWAWRATISRMRRDLHAPLARSGR